MRVAIIGAGYVGLTTGVCLAKIGHAVVCVDNNQDKLAQLRRGECPIFEPGLTDLLHEVIRSEKFTVTDDIATAAQAADVIFICVNTPPKADGQADLRYVEAVARVIATAITGYKVVVDKSTVPVRTAEKVQATIIRESNGKAEVDVVSNPEFLREGSAVHDTLNPDRIVIGADTERARELMVELYQPIIDQSHCAVIQVSVRSAELIKHGANSFLAAKISFANLIAEACEEAGADATEVLTAIGLDARIGKQFLNHGIGFGGSCFPKDLAAFTKTLDMLGIPADFLVAVGAINQRAIDRFIKKIERELWVLDGKRIAVLGLAFKPNTDDIRNAPALALIARLQQEGAQIAAYDPEAMANAQRAIPGLETAIDPYSAVTGADAVVLCTEWDEFTKLDFARIKTLMTGKIIFDGRNCLNQATLEDLGFRYIGIGR
jgi:UDPglucose 6-dehydrogenase